MHGNILISLGNLIPRVCNHLPLMCKRWKDLRREKPKPRVRVHPFPKGDTGEGEAAGAGLRARSMMVFREGGRR